MKSWLATRNELRLPTREMGLFLSLQHDEPGHENAPRLPARMGEARLTEGYGITGVRLRPQRCHGLPPPPCGERTAGVEPVCHALWREYHLLHGLLSVCTRTPCPFSQEAPALIACKRFPVDWNQLWGGQRRFFDVST